MRVTQVHLQGVTTHQDTTLDLPATGLVLVTGANGSGKSTLLEAVPWTLWGKAIRGTSLWSGPTGRAQVTADGVTYWRSLAGKRVLAGSDPGPHWESNRDLVDHVVQLYGTLDDWRRGHLLTPADAALFTLSGDVGRKRLIESLAGAEAYDVGHATARAALAQIQSEVQSIERRIQDVQRVRDRAQAALDQRPPAPVAEPAPVPPPAWDAPRLAELDRAHAAIVQDARVAQSEVQRARGQLSRAQALVTEAQRQLRALGLGDCPTCGQPVHQDPSEVARATCTLQDTQAALRAAEDTEAQSLETLAGLTAEAQEIQLARASLASQRDSHQAALSAHQRALVLHRQGAAMAAALEQAREDRLAEVRLATESLEAAQSELAAAQVQLAHVAAATAVLGPKALRATLLEQTLEAVATVANQWLGVMGDLRVGLVVGPKGAVDLQVHGAGDGAYSGCSGGERRRVDLALAMALFRLGEAATGSQGGTVWCDEVFDPLDGPGVAGVAEALSELARDRCVVVVAHQAAESLRAVATLAVRVDQGHLVLA